MLGIARHELDDVCLVIDMECFRVDGVYRCREFGYCSWRGDSGRVACQTVESTRPGRETTSPFSHQRGARTLLHRGQARGSHLVRTLFYETTLRRIRHARQATRGFQRRTRRKRSFELSEYALFGFRNVGMSQVRSIASRSKERTDLRLACHSQQASLRHGRMRRLF